VIFIDLIIFIHC